MLERTLCRFVIFFVVFILFSLTGKIIGNDAVGNIHSSKKHSVLAKIISALCFVSGMVIGALAIYELINGDPNEWLFMKVFFYLMVWLGALTVFFARCSYDAASLGSGWSKKSMTVVLIGSILTLILCICFCCGGVVGMTYSAF